MPAAAAAAVVGAAKAAGAATAAKVAAGAGAARAASFATGFLRGLGSLGSQVGRGLAGLQLKMAYAHDQLLRNWGATIIKNAEKWGVPKRFAREYVRRYMYPNLIGGPHGHRPHVRGGSASQPAKQVKPPGIAAQAAPSQGIRKPQTAYAAGPGAQQPPQHVAADAGMHPANVQFAAPAPIGTSYSSYAAGGDVAAQTPTISLSPQQQPGQAPAISAPPQQQPVNVDFASGDDVVGLSLDFSNLEGASDVDLAEGIGIGDITQSQLGQAAAAEQNTASVLESNLTDKPGRATDAALSATESESAQAMQSAQAGVEKPDVTDRALAASARASSRATSRIPSPEPKPVSTLQVSASGASKVPLDEMVAGVSAPQVGFSPINVVAANIPAVGVSRFHVSPPSPSATYTATASGYSPQHIMFGPTRFEVT